MTAINKLTQNKSANADDLVPIWDSKNQRTRSLSLKSISELSEMSDGKYVISGTYKDGNLTLNYNNGGGFTVQGFAFKSTDLEDMPSALEPGKTLVVNESGDGYELAESGGSENVTEGAIPKKDGGGFVDSPMSVDESGNVTMAGSFTADELITNIASLNLGDQKKISGLGEGIEVHDISRDRHKFIVTQWLDKDEDTSAFQYDQGPYALINIQPDFDVTLNNPQFVFETLLGDQILYGFEVKVNTPQNNCVAQIFRHTELLTLAQDAKPIWEEEFNNVISDTLQLGSPVVLDGNTKYVFKITGEFLGNSEGKMYYSIGARLATKQNLAGTESGLNVESVVAGNKIAVNNDDPKNPIISWAPGGEQFLPGVNVSQGGKPVEDAADTLDFADDQFVLTTNNKGQVQIELGETGPGTNVVGLFESTVELLAEYPNPADGLYAYVLQGDGKYPDDRYESKGGSWVGMGGITGETVVDDDKYKSLIMGDGLKVDDSEGSATISTSGNTPVLTFDVTADSTRSVDASFVGKLINIIQTPPSISIPMQITLVDHSLFETGDTIKIAADRDGDNAYSNYYFAVYFNDSTGRNIAKYPANNITMVRTDTAWDVQLDGRFTNVSIRPKAQFNIPYAPDEQYNTPVNAFVFAESPAVEFEVDEDTNTRIVKLELDKAIPDDPTFKTISIDTNGSGQPNFTAAIKQDGELHTIVEATREFRVSHKDIGTGLTNTVFGIDNNQAQFLVQPYYGNSKLATEGQLANYIQKHTNAELNHLEVAYQGKYDENRVHYPCVIQQGSSGRVNFDFTRELKFTYKNPSSGSVDSSSVLTLSQTGATYEGDTSQPNNPITREALDNEPQKEWFAVANGTLATNGNRPTGGSGVEGELAVWHNVTSDSTTDPANELKVLFDGAYDKVNSFSRPLRFRLSQQSGTRNQYWTVEDNGWQTEGNVWHISASKVTGDNLVVGINTIVEASAYFIDDDISDYHGQGVGVPSHVFINNGDSPTQTQPVALYANASNDASSRGDITLSKSDGYDEFEVIIDCLTKPTRDFRIKAGELGMYSDKRIRTSEVWSCRVKVDWNNSTNSNFYWTRLDNGASGYILEEQFNAKSGYDALISGGGSTKTITYADNAKILKITNSTVKVELLQGMNLEDRPHGYFKYINSHNADVAFEWYDRNGTQITNNVPSVCPKDTVVEVFADYAKDQYVLNFSQSKVISSTISDSQKPNSQNFINISDVSVDYPTDANGDQYRPNNVVVMVLDTSNMINGLNITVTSADSYAGHYNSVGSVCIDEHGEWSSQSNVNAYRLNDGTDTYCVFSKATGSWVLVVADVDHNNNGSLVGGSPVNLYNDGQLPESYGDYSIQNDLESIESEYFTQADVDIDYHTNSDANSYFNVSFGTAKPAGVIFYK